ncbi:MAG: hypothetical protein QME75_09900 [Deltaproteobacteria bacterium]|nr:hypothetical protein [Deltaproteobacteria bacterium]
MKLSKYNLFLSAKYAVASEFYRRNILKLTLTDLRKNDIICHTSKNAYKIKVKAKQGSEWPGIKDIYGNDMILILVDFEDKEIFERPDFYLLTSEDWRNLLLQNYSKYLENGDVELDDKNTITWICEEKPYKGVLVKPNEIIEFKEKWDKIKGLT